MDTFYHIDTRATIMLKGTVSVSVYLRQTILVYWNIYVSIIKLVLSTSGSWSKNDGWHYRMAGFVILSEDFPKLRAVYDELPR